jgi:hypothetical protein
MRNFKMKQTTGLTAFATALLPAAALAHPGAHDAVEKSLLAHMLESPFHLAIVVLAFGLVGYAAFRTGAMAKSRQKRSDRQVRRRR